MTIKKSIIKKLWRKTEYLKRAFTEKTQKTIHDQKQFSRIIELERDRVHRGNKQFTVVLFRIENEFNGNSNTVELIYRITNRVRKIDQIGWYDSQHIGVLLPNTDKDGAEIITKEIIRSTGDIENLYDIVTMSYPE